MRLLAIDAGNSRIKWGLHVDGQWHERGGGGGAPGGSPPSPG
jgi:hypothetical protein